MDPVRVISGSESEIALSEEPIRVLHVVGRMHRAGIETFIMNLYRNIDRSRIQFDFLTHYGVEAEYNDEIRSLGGRIYDMPKIKDGSHVYYSKLHEYRQALKKFFSEHRGEYTAVHGHLTQLATFYFPAAKRYGDVQCLVSHSHNSHSRAGLVALVTYLLHRPVSMLATDRFACSEAAAKWLYPKRYIKKGKVTIVYNAIDTRRFAYNEDNRSEARHDLGLGCEIAVFHIGRFETVKNQKRVVQITRTAKSMGLPFKTFLVGTGPDEETIAELISRWGLQNDVVMLGVRSDVEKLMHAADILVMPSLYEGLPLTVIEAQAAGLPCVLSSTVSLESDVTGRVSFLPLEGSDEEWISEILSVTGKGKRSEGAIQVTQAGYDIRQVAEQLQAFYLSKQG